MRDPLRVTVIDTADLRALFLQELGPGRARQRLAAPSWSSRPAEVTHVPARGWGTTLGCLRSDDITDPFDVLVTSATAELDDPSREPATALIELSRFVRERHRAPVVVLNASTLLPPDVTEPAAHGTEPLDLRIRRLDLAIMEASKATALSVLDADRLLAEIPHPVKVTGSGYPPEMNRALRTALSSILGELDEPGDALRSVRIPAMGPIADLSVERWLKTEGDAVAIGDVLCEVRVRGPLVRHVTSAVELAAIEKRGPVIRRIIERDQPRDGAIDDVRSVVAGGAAVLRRVLRADGESVTAGDPIAVLSEDPATPLRGPERELRPFRITLRAADRVVGPDAAPGHPGRDRAPHRLVRRNLSRVYRRFAPELVTEKGRGWSSFRGTRTVLLRRGGEAPVRGIYLRGACDVPSLFTLAPIVIDGLEGSLCIHSAGLGVAGAQSDLLLQTHAGVPDGFAEEVSAKLGIPRDHFRPTLFEPRFTVRDLAGGPRSFPKTVVALSVLPDLSRTAYRHRETGYLVDPGSAWLNDLKGALQDLSFVRWFSEHFERVGRISVEGFAENYRRLIPLIQRETGASVLVFNALEIEPFDPTHDYSDRNIELATRRRRFNIALDELSRELGFHVVDVDRVLKTQGVDRQVDFSHFPVERMRAVAEDALRILRRLDVV